ncbi:MAG: glycoside hydrolase/phage tail family protein, partial [Pseudomonadota bacterium]
MATILFAAAGAALGGAVGGSVFGLSSVVIGRAIGATVGRVIDQKLLGSGSEVVEGPRLNRFRVLGASEGSPVGRSYGRTRIGGQIIWTTRFKERVSKKSAGGKGGGGGGEVRTYSYSVSLAVALGEGLISSIGRVWADGVEVPRNKIDMRVYSGTEDQLPDPLMEAIEGAGNVPAYRGLAYVVIENMQLADYGNRVPQLSFEVIRPTDGSKVPDDVQPIGSIVRGVALVPGSGEYSLATSQVRKRTAPGRTSLVNVSTNAGETDFLVSMRQLEEEVPSCEAVSLVVSWFGNDLRAGHCFLKPKVEQKQTMIDSMPWIVSAATRDVAEVVPYVDGRPIYGGTPADESVIEAIQALKAQGKHVTFYPFILMDQMEGNTLPNPWTGATGQPHLPWRGRITTSLAPGVAGSSDGTAAAASEVADFFGDAEVSNFTPDGKSIFYTGPTEWSYRRFILHYARLCALAGGVDAFCIGSEMRALTQIRGEDDTFPAVSALIALAQDVRAVLGPNVKIGYAADWSEYFGYQPQDGSGDVFFHLDPLWSSPEIDFIGIDNYMPLSDWRDGTDHLDAIEGWPSVYDMDYLRGGVAGGEGFDWYYPDQAARDTQTRAPITDGAYGEPWVFRYKDLRGWWENPHHNRKGGVRQADPTDWVPQSKPFWFTEFGCAALDKSTNQPNKFLDPKSSESRLAHYSNGRRDEFIQAQYLRAVTLHWADAAQNPVSPVYGGPMVDMSKAHVWAWDVRPYPAFPARSDLWSDGANYDRGHWLNGRTSNEALAAVISDICARSGMTDIDVSSVIGNVRGFEMETGQGARAALQPLMLAYGLDASEREGSLVFSMRGTPATVEIGADMLAVSTEFEGDLERLRESAPEIPDRVQLNSVKSGSDFSAQAVEAVFPGETVQTTAQSELPLVMTQGEAQSVADRWLAEARVSRDSVRLSLPPSALWVGAGDTVSI